MKSDNFTNSSFKKDSENKSFISDAYITESFSKLDNLGRGQTNKFKDDLTHNYLDSKELSSENSPKDNSEGLDQARVIAQGHYRLGKVYYDKADLETAKHYFLMALEKTQYPKDAFAIFKCYGFLIRVYSESEQELEANRFIQKAQDLVDKLGNDLGTLGAEYFYNIGMVHTYRGELDLALENFKLSHFKAHQENEPELLSKSLFATAKACYHLQSYNDAQNYLSQLSELLDILQKGYLKGSMHLLYGNLKKDMGKHKEALEHFDKAIQFLQNKNCWNLYGYILLAKGITYKRMGEYSSALIHFRLAQNTVNSEYKRLKGLIQDQVNDVNDSSVDLYLDRHNRVIHEKNLGKIDFKHRFVLLEILFLLAKNPGGHYNKEDLAKSIWKDEYNPLIHDKLIYTSISRLRKLIEPKGGNRKYIVRGKDGYTFNPRVNARFHRENDPVAKKVIGNIEISSPV